MKLLLTCFFLFFFSCLLAQREIRPAGNKIPSRAEINQLIIDNRTPRKTILPFNTLNNPAALSGFIHANSARQLTAIPANKSISGKILAIENCVDSSFAKLNGIVDNALYVLTITHTKDDGVLIAGVGFELAVAHPSWQSYGILIKVDNMGNILWKKLYKDEQNHEKYEIYISFVTELQNGDILTVSSLDTAQGSSSPDFTHHHTLITRLTSTGSLVWYKTYTSLLSVDNQYMPFAIKAVAEAPSGDLMLCGRTLNGNGQGLNELVIRMDNAGNKIWDANLTRIGDFNSGTEGINVFLENGNITVVGIAYGVSSQFILAGSLHFLTIDYATGAILNKRTYTPAYNDPIAQFKNFTYYTTSCVKLNNGHYLLWGQTFSNFSQTTTPVDHFAVIEFDAAHNIVDAYTITGNLLSNYSVDNLYFDSNGKGLFQLFTGVYPEAIVFEGSIHNKQLLKERTKNYGNTTLSLNGGFGPNQRFCFFNDGSYLNCGSYFEGSLLANSYFQFKKMHDSDTSSFCLGWDSITVKMPPYLINEDPVFPITPPVFDQVKLTDVRVTYIDDYAYRYKEPCHQKSNCDTLKIHGDSLHCNVSQPIIFSVYKNPLCGSFAEWSIDTSVISSLNQINDTSVAITFKNINWKGKIYASLSTGKCTIPLYDSLNIHIVQSGQVVSLGADTVLCSGNAITLHAGAGFAGYSWQDGSVDSIFTVTNTGQYYVEARDYCGNSYKDTILVNGAIYPFTVGPDRSKCNNDIITLTATPGFINYQWLPGYNINAGSANTAIVFPATDTSYIVMAEKSPGCVVKDTIQISVLHSPPIDLGKDTSFCQGESIKLNAGAGFTGYVWNTGAVSQTINAATTGNYSVKAAYSNGCFSYDTLKVLQVTPQPDFKLGNNKDTILCEGLQLSYHFNLPANYLWNDGSTDDTKTIVTPGLIWLKVSQQGCAVTDSINLSFKPSPVVHLGNDTTLCEGATKLLTTPSTQAIFVWQDGSNQPTYTVTKPGLYIVQANENGCEGRDSILITYNLKPLFSLGADQFICDGEQLILKPDNSSLVNYLWQDRSTEPSFTVKNRGTYSLVETNSCGSYTDSIKIDMGPCALQLPSAFTPDYNGVNDLFRIKYPFPAKEFKLVIFNRWGEKVFETNDMHKGWDGKFNGLDQPLGVYAWVVSVTYSDDRKQSLKGIVTLIR